jgi:hypothetical protein
MKRSSVLAIALLLPACDLGTEPEITDRAPVLFEIEYVNYAFVPTWRGFYIDATGTLFSYDRSSERDAFPPDKAEFTHEELMQKYDPNRSRVRALPTADVQTASVLIPAAASGTLGPSQTRCADAGVLSFRAYIFDHTRQVFRTVVIRYEGDRAQANQSDAARQIFQYLDSLKLVQHINGCEP